MIALCAALALTAAEARALLDRIAGEPTVESLTVAAVREAELSPERMRSWMRRVRLAPLLPQVSVRLDRGVQYDESWDDGPTGEKRSVDTDDDTGWRVQATWDLGRLLFEPNEIGVAREGMNLVELRHEVLREIVRLYFERRRLQVEAVLEPDAPAERAVAREARIREIESAIDAMTGGAMSRGKRERAARRP